MRCGLRTSSASTCHDDVARSSALCWLALKVSSINTVKRFYRDVLDFEEIGENLRLGDFNLVLRPSAPFGRHMTVNSRAHDHWFRHVAIVVRAMAIAYSDLSNTVSSSSPRPHRCCLHGIGMSQESKHLFPRSGSHVFELIQFPPDEGNAHWQQPGDALFQGVDHTAIVLSRTEASLRFYRDQLGF